jgi:hypothetical protein
MGTLVLLDLMGGVALLLWGLHMVQSGIMRAFGPDLRRLLSGTSQPLRSVRCGAGADRASAEQHSAPHWRPPIGTWNGCARVGPRPWRRLRFTSTCCATSSVFTPISAPWPIRCWRAPGKRLPRRSPKAIRSHWPRRNPRFHDDECDNQAPLSAAPLARGLSRVPKKSFPSLPNTLLSTAS